MNDEQEATSATTPRSSASFTEHTFRPNGAGADLGADVGAADIVADVDTEAEIRQLALLSQINYDRARKDAARRLGIQLSTLDAEVERRRLPTLQDRGGSDEQGEAFQLPEIEPWHEPVDGESLITEVEKAIQRHIVLEPHQALAVALWAFHSHALDVAEHTPRLHISSPVHRCGKSSLLKVISLLVRRPLATENITTAALFRLMGSDRPTVLIDEVDSFLKDDEDLRGLLNAGHDPKSAVVRVVGEKLEPRCFKVFGAVVLCGIRDIPTTLEDRSITISLRRRLKTEQIERLRYHTAQLDVLARKMVRWIADHKGALPDNPALPDELHDRAQDNWRLLIAIADTLSPAVGERARRAALYLESNKGEEDSFGIQALEDVHAIFERENLERLSSGVIVDKLVAMEERRWSEWRRGQPMTKRSLARLLNPFSIHPKQMKFQTGAPAKGYERAPIKQAWERYCVRTEPGTEEPATVDDERIPY